jgi:predicted transcriptional regulator
VVRAMLAKELMTKHKLKQAETAHLLGVSQPAISLYCKQIRGKSLNLEDDEDITKLIKKLATSLAEEDSARTDFIPMYCEICMVVRAKGLLCKLHKIFDPTIDLEECTLCKSQPVKCIL